MSIMVHGVKVRVNDLVSDYDAEFAELKESAQKRLLKEYPDVFFYDALRSEYPRVRNLAILLKEEVSSETINNAIRLVHRSYGPYDSDLILKLLSYPNLQLDTDLRDSFSRLDIYDIKVWVAGDKNTKAEMLTKMILDDIWYFKCRDTDVTVKAIQNDNFEYSEELKFEIRKRCYTVSEYKELITRIEKLVSLRK